MICLWNHVSEEILLQRALDRLQKLLGARAELELDVIQSNTALPDTRTDAIWTLRSQGIHASIIVEVRTSFAPRDVDRVLGGLSPTIRGQLRPSTILVVAPWFSPRSRDLLEQRGYSYLDMTGNLLLAVPNPIVYLRDRGSDTDPDRPHRAPAGLAGASINALIRALADITPPYRLTDLANVTGLSHGYISRSLAALDDQALISRVRGMVVDVDWEGLLRARADAYDLMRSNRAQTFVAQRGSAAAYTAMVEHPLAFDATVTGSFAAYEIAPIAAPAQLALYTHQSDQVIKQLSLLPTDRGADVVLLTPASDSQLVRPRKVDGLRHVGVSQLALDCLAGNGRLPEEGEAIIEWMHTNPQWRLPDLQAAEQ